MVSVSLSGFLNYLDPNSPDKPKLIVKVCCFFTLKNLKGYPYLPQSTVVAESVVELYFSHVPFLANFVRCTLYSD
jgi:hypothetical protein